MASYPGSGSGSGPGSGPTAPGQDRESRVSIGRVLVAVVRPNPIILLVRWRYEIVLLVAVPAGLLWATDQFGLWWTAIGAGTGGGLLAARPVGRFVAGRFWCVVTPHRLRTGCAQAWVHSRAGKVPAIVWTSARPYGERVVLWCHAGTTAAEVADAAPALAVACWARVVHVEQSPHHAHLVAVHVVRRGDEPW